MATYKKVISGLTPGTWGFQFIAKDDDGRYGKESAVFYYTVVGDSEPPPLPSKPYVEAVLGGVFVKWNETAYISPIDFNRVDVYVSSGGAYAKVGSIATISGGFTWAAPEGGTGPYTFKLVAVDRSGNGSAFSDASDPVSPITVDVDTSPPNPPGSLSAVAYNDPTDSSGSTGYIVLSWGSSSSGDVYGYYIRYGTSSSNLDTYTFSAAGTTSTTIRSLRSGTTYYFQVNATDGNNPSAYIPATPVSATVPGDTTGPAAPSGLVVVAGFNNVIAYWNRNTENDVDLGRGTYQFQLSTSNTFATVLQDRTITGTVASFTGLTTGTTYYVRVRAIDSSGNIGGWSSIGSATPGKINAELSVTSGTIVGDLVAANTLVGDKIIANSVDADRFKTNTGIVGKLFVGDDAGANKITIDGTAATPAVYYGTGTYNNANTPFYFDALGKFSLKDQLTWDGASLSVKGSLNVTQASTFTGNVTLNNGGDIILNGGVVRATGSTGRVDLTSAGVFGYNATSGGTALFSLFANTGQVKIDGGTIGGWTLSSGSITTTNSQGQTVGLYSTGQLYMGPNFSVGANGSVTVTGTINVVGTGSNVPTNTDLTNSLANKLNTSSFTQGEIIKKINNSTNETKINGGILETGTVIADSVVATWAYLGEVAANKITGTEITGKNITQSDGLSKVEIRKDAVVITGSTVQNAGVRITGNNGAIAGWLGAWSQNNLEVANHYTENYIDWLTNNTINIYANNGLSMRAWNGNTNITGGTSSGGNSTITLGNSISLASNNVTTVSGTRLNVVSTDTIAFRVWDEGTANERVRVNGSLTSDNTLRVASGSTTYRVEVGGSVRATSFPTSSALRYKNNIEEFEVDESALLQMKTYSFDWNDESKKDQGLINQKTYGVIADEWFNAGLKDFVRIDENGDIDSFVYDKVGIALIPIVKRLRDKVEYLENKIKEMES